MKNLFACDLDNTLIHSHKKRREDDICVEIYDGREQSFISGKSLAFLKKISEKILFIPITTRSTEQYQRIFWTEDFTPKFAIVANGAYILDGKNQKNFLREEIITKNLAEMENLHKKYSSDENFNICRIVDESFLFLRCKDEIDAEKIHFETKLIVQHTGKKIYLFPPALNKGNALLKLKKIFSPDKIFCAGDSEIDISMLKVADMAFAPKNLHGKGFVECSDSPEFAEEFLQEIFYSNC